MSRMIAILAVIAFSGCTTMFYGAARVPGGPDGCKAVCEGWGMELAGMVQMGEYSDGCICQVKGAKLSVASTATVAPAVIGVHEGMMRAARASTAQSSQR